LFRLVPAIHVWGAAAKKDVDARVKPAHDGSVLTFIGVIARAAAGT
jgi:hypothetical protein